MGISDKKNLVALVVVVIAVILIFIYLKPQKDDTDPSTVINEPVLPVQNKGNEEVIKTLSLLNNIKLDKDFFDNPVFKSLDDFSIELSEPFPGRYNPFAPT